jgi:nucleotide-binding universal stress UspA family protein
MQLILAVDGSTVSARAARHVAKLAFGLRELPRLVLLTVDPPMMPGVERKLGKAAIQRYHDENADYALRDARAILRKAGVVFEERIIIGEVAPSIIKACTPQRCDLLVMGSRGRGAMTSAVLGSVALKILAGSKVPVTLVR